MWDWLGPTIAIYALVCCACGMLAAEVADAKGRKYQAWFFVGLLTGVFGLIAAAGLPDELPPRS